MNFPADGTEPFAMKKLYTFTSTRTKQGYMVWVEVYDSHFYAVKFHLRRDKNNKNRYSVMSGLGEARPVINTCVRIMSEIAGADELSSFGFIGAGMVGEKNTNNTKRFKVYRRLMATYFSEEFFLHLSYVEKSAYVLLRRKMLEMNPGIEEMLQRRFVELYPYFE